MSRRSGGACCARRVAILLSLIGFFVGFCLLLQPDHERPAYLLSGSMAETFWGPSFHLRCVSCRFPVRCDAERADLDPRDRNAVCPNCGYRNNRLRHRQHGQQVLYDDRSGGGWSPQRWQVVAFRSAHDSGRAGIKRIVFEEFYRDERIFEVSQILGIELVELHRELGRAEAAP